MPDLTDEQIDEEIRKETSPLVDIQRLHQVLGVPKQRVQERWLAIQDHVSKLREGGASRIEILAQTGLPERRLAGLLASWTKAGATPAGSVVVEPEMDEAQKDAGVASITLERDLQAHLWRNIQQLDPALSVVPGGKEYVCAAGRIDILCQASDGALVVVELKIGFADDAAIGQLLGYMGAITAERPGVQVRGILVAKGFDPPRVSLVAHAVPNLSLKAYEVRFTFHDAAG